MSGTHPVHDPCLVLARSKEMKHVSVGKRRVSFHPESHSTFFRHLKISYDRRLRCFFSQHQASLASLCHLQRSIRYRQRLIPHRLKRNLASRTTFDDTLKFRISDRLLTTNDERAVGATRFQDACCALSQDHDQHAICPVT